jgi:DNA mismatch endonuclease (patch repair protein)
MAAVRSHGNKRTEIRLAKLLRSAAIKGWRRQQPVFGKPDFAFAKLRVAVFVDGCFWHGCRKCYRRPASSRKYWDAKVSRNKSRDQLVNRELRKLGWRVFRIWECALAKRPLSCLKRIEKALHV